MTTHPLFGWGLAALLLTAASFSATAVFEAPSPGADLEPFAGAELIVDLIQGQESVLWSTLAGPVTSFTALGWPSDDGIHELGGALMMERPVNGMAGVLDFGEKPMSIVFNLSG